jgi:hypothetical protein
VHKIPWIGTALRAAEDALADLPLTRDLGGFLIVCVPHRDLYEKRTRLPSRWNDDHKWFFLPDKGEQPHTLGLAEMLASEIPAGEVQYVAVQSEGWDDVGPNTHSHGEYSIEAVIRKPPST